MLMYFKRLIALFFVLVLNITPSFFSGNSYTNCVITDKNEMVVYLDSNPTTGYDWEYEISDENVIVLEKEDYKQDFSFVPRDGAGGTDIFVFKGKAEGEFTVVLSYLRQWDEASVYKICTVKGSVDGGGNVKIASFDIASVE